MEQYAPLWQVIWEAIQLYVGRCDPNVVYARYHMHSQSVRLLPISHRLGAAGNAPENQW